METYTFGEIVEDATFGAIEAIEMYVEEGKGLPGDPAPFVEMAL